MFGRSRSPAPGASATSREGSFSKTMSSTTPRYGSPNRPTSAPSGRTSSPSRVPARTSSPSRSIASPRTGSPSLSRSYLAHLGPKLSASASEEFQSIMRNCRADDPNKHIEALEIALKTKFMELETSKHEVRVVNKELSERERGLQNLQASLDRQKDYTNRAQEELGLAKLNFENAEKAKKQAVEELRQKTIQVSLTERSHQALQEKHQNVRDLKSYQDRLFASEQEVKRLNNLLIAKEGELRSAKNSVKLLGADLQVSQEKAEDNMRKEASNQFAQLNKQIAELAEENKVLDRQVKVLNTGSMDAAFTRAEEVEVGHQDMIVLQSEVKRLKHKLDASEAEVRAERQALATSQRRLETMHDVIRSGSHRRFRKQNNRDRDPLASPSSPATGYVPMSPAALAANNPALHPLPDSVKEEDEEEVEDDNGAEAPVHSIDTVPAGMFELLQKEVAALRQEVRERDRHLLDKDTAVEQALRKADNLNKMRELDLKKYQRETTEMKRELKQLKGDSNRGVRTNSGKWAM